MESNPYGGQEERKQEKLRAILWCSKEVGGERETDPKICLWRTTEARKDKSTHRKHPEGGTYMYLVGVSPLLNISITSMVRRYLGVNKLQLHAGKS